MIQTQIMVNYHAINIPKLTLKMQKELIIIDRS